MLETLLVVTSQETGLLASKEEKLGILLNVLQ